MQHLDDHCNQLSWNSAKSLLGGKRSAVFLEFLKAVWSLGFKVQQWKASMATKYLQREAVVVHESYFIELFSIWARDDNKHYG